MTRAELRQQLLARRSQLSDAQRHQAGITLAQRLLAFPAMRNAKRVAAFLSFGSELDTSPLIEALWQEDREVYLPVIHPFSRGNLLFLRYTPQTRLVYNHMKIGEPALDVRHALPLAKLDVMVTPLLGFDKQGNRMGMGGGYYDRTLQHWQQYHFMPIGIALDCQQVDTVPREDWDIPLPVILTPTACWQNPR